MQSHFHYSIYLSLKSIGLINYEISIDNLQRVRDLLAIIVPPAVFVAVMALQLKYFSPHISSEE